MFNKTKKKSPKVLNIAYYYAYPQFITNAF